MYTRSKQQFLEDQFYSAVCLWNTGDFFFFEVKEGHRLISSTATSRTVRTVPTFNSCTKYTDARPIAIQFPVYRWMYDQTTERTLIRELRGSFSVIYIFSVYTICIKVCFCNVIITVNKYTYIDVLGIYFDTLSIHVCVCTANWRTFGRLVQQLIVSTVVIKMA